MNDQKTFDLAEINLTQGANDGFEVELYHPATNIDLGIKITVLGKDSDTFKKISTAQARKRMNKIAKGGTFKASAISPEEVEEDNIELLAACTKGWVGMKEGGKEITFSKEAAIDLYTRHAWMREQVDAAIGDRANFLKG